MVAPVTSRKIGKATTHRIEDSLNPKPDGAREAKAEDEAALRRIRRTVLFGGHSQRSQAHRHQPLRFHLAMRLFHSRLTARPRPHQKPNPNWTPLPSSVSHIDSEPLIQTISRSSQDSYAPP